MNKLFYYNILFSLFTSIGLYAQSDILVGDTILSYPFLNDQSGGLFLNTPSNFQDTIIYDAKLNQYFIQDKIGRLDVGVPIIMDFEDFQLFNSNKSISNYWKTRSNEKVKSNNSSFGLPRLYVPGKAFDKIFGGNAVDIRPQGSSELIFGVKINKLDNPALPEEQRKTTSFDFQEKIQMNVIGKIGDKLKLTTNFNTESTFDFENQMKLEYTGYEDDIIKKIEVGNVSLPLNGTLITGSQSLFGLKTQLQFGRTTITGIIS